LIALIDNSQPNGLNSASSERDAKKAFAFAIVQHGSFHTQVFVLANGKSLEKRPVVGTWRVRHREPERFPTSQESHSQCALKGEFE
jgi:hypothetical protein